MRCGMRFRPVTTTSGSTWRSGQIALAEFHDPGAGARAFRLRVRAGPPGVAAGFQGAFAARPAQQSTVLSRRSTGWSSAWKRSGRHDDAKSLRCARPRGSRAVRLEAVLVDGFDRLFAGASEIARRRLEGFFDFKNFSDLQGFADRDRTTAERDPKAEGMAWHTRPPQPCRRKGSRTFDEHCYGGRDVGVVLSRSSPGGRLAGGRRESPRAGVS